MEIQFIFKGIITQEITWLAPDYTLDQVLLLLKTKVASTTLVHSLQPAIVRNDTGAMIALIRTVDTDGDMDAFSPRIIIG
jgi:hypothetical protein